MENQNNDRLTFLQLLIKTNDDLRKQLQDHFAQNRSVHSSSPGLRGNGNDQVFKANPDNSRKTRRQTIYELLDSPVYLKESSLEDGEVEFELNRLIDKMRGKNIHLSASPTKDPRLLYKFITEHLFFLETEERGHSSYTSPEVSKESHSDREVIQVVSEMFLIAWFSRTLSSEPQFFADEMVLETGAVLTKDEALAKIHFVEEAYPVFFTAHYDFGDCRFQKASDNESRFAYVEGYLSYSVYLENGEALSFDGTYRIFLSFEKGQWKIFYFMLPGFTW